MKFYLDVFKIAHGLEYRRMSHETQPTEEIETIEMFAATQLGIRIPTIPAPRPVLPLVLSSFPRLAACCSPMHPTPTYWGSGSLV